MVTILLFLALLIDGGGFLLRREQIINTAELSAAAGGRVVTEVLAYAAGLNNPNPTEQQKNMALNFVSVTDRNAIEDGSFVLPGTTIKSASEAEVDKYALLNMPARMSFDANTDLNFIYIPEANNCLDEENKTAEVAVGVKGRYRYLFGGLLAIFGLSPEREFTATGTYKFQICP